ncbi:MAG: glycosyltransferase family 87 protein [Phycisphaerae bacterium]
MLTHMIGLLTPERVRRYPMFLFAVTWGIYLGSVVRSNHWIEPGGEIVGRDYFQFYMAGDMINRGQLDHLYDFAAQEDYQKQFMERINPKWSGTCVYRYPPHYALAMSFLTTLGYGPSLMVWWTLSAACFVMTALVWRRWMGADSVGVPVLLAMCLPPWFLAFAGGQNTFFSLLILTAFCALLMSGRDIWAGLVLSALALKFQLLIVPAGLLLFKRRWGAVIGLCVGGLVTLLVTAALLGPHAISDYLTFGADLNRIAQIEQFDLHKQHSWHGFFALLGRGWMPGTTAWILTAAVTVVSLALLLSAWRGPWSRHGSRFALQLSALMMATLLTSPHLAHYDMLIATLPAVLWLLAAKRADDPTPLQSFKILLAAGFIWLVITPAVTSALPVQLSPLLMLAWLISVHRKTTHSPIPDYSYRADR